MSYYTIRKLARSVDLICHMGNKLVLKTVDPSLNPNELVAAEIRHPGVVQIESLLPRDTKASQTGLGTITKYHSQTLEEWLLEKKPDTQNKLKLIYQLWSTVAELHKVGIVHLDIKPDNVVVDSKGSALLIDFGHARKLGAGTGSLVTDRCYMTSSYAPIEALVPGRDGCLNYGPHSDVWSLAMLAYFVLSDGQHLLPSNKTSAILSFHKTHLATPVKCQAVLAKGAASMAPLLVKMLSCSVASRLSLEAALAAFSGVEGCPPLPLTTPVSLVVPGRRYPELRSEEGQEKLAGHAKRIVEYYCRYSGDSSARTLYLACDIFYRSAYLGSKLWGRLAFIAVQLAGACQDVIPDKQLRTMRRFFKVNKDDPRLGYVTDVVLANALVGIVQPEWLYDSLDSKLKIQLGVERYLVAPQAYFAFSGAAERVTPPPVTVASLKIFWQGF